MTLKRIPSSQVDHLSLYQYIKSDNENFIL